MLELRELLALCALLSGIAVVPGMEMALVAGTTMRQGAACAWLALAGVAVGGMILTAWTTAVMAFVLVRGAWLLFAVLSAGSLYLGWMALRFLRESCRGATSARPSPQATHVTRRGAIKPVLMGMTTSVTNPKAHVFLLSVLPPLFVRHASSICLVAVQFSLLSALVKAAIYGTVILGIQASAQRVMHRPCLMRWISGAAGFILLAAAALAAIQAAHVLERHGIPVAT